MKHSNKCCILFFVKYPVLRGVKTRLAEHVGHDVATDLYKSFVADILITLHTLSVNFRIVFYPPDAGDQFQQWLGEKYSYAPQIGQDLGQRMKNAFLQAFSDGFNSVVIIGSDSPDLPADYLDLGFTALDTNDVVVGPSSDGGYYLIGFAREAFLPDAFEQITWSSTNVFERTLNILKQHKQRVYLLPQWHDVDSVSDLNKLLERNRNTIFGLSSTISVIRKIEGQMTS